MPILDWRTELKTWLITNSKIITEDLVLLQKEFVQRFPKEKIRDLTLEQYALGTEHSQNSFCYWLEFRTAKLGSIGGGSVAKHGVWWSKKDNDWRYNKIFSSAQDALMKLLDGIATQVSLAEQDKFDELDKIGRQMLGSNRYSLRAKPLFLYFPEKFLPFNNPEHIRHYLGIFGETPHGDMMSLNRQLLAVMSSKPEFEGFDPVGMASFLWDSFNPKKQVISNKFSDVVKRFIVILSTEKYRKEERDYKEKLIKALGGALSDEKMNSNNFVSGLEDVS